ncbi:MAG: hypothetical protein KC589_01060 [Nanoarchaeota archaeon]|nr:hypothetical protein [Nanoarchaeota archaeon]
MSKFIFSLLLILFFFILSFTSLAYSYENNLETDLEFKSINTNNKEVIVPNSTKNLFNIEKEFPILLNSSIYWLENNYYNNYFRYKFFPLFNQTTELTSFNFDVYYVRQLAFYWFLSKENLANNKTLIYAKNYLNYSRNFVYEKNTSIFLETKSSGFISEYKLCKSFIDFGNGTNLNMNAFYLLFLVEMHKQNLTSTQDIKNMNCIKNYLISLESPNGAYYFYDLEHHRNFIDFYGTGEALLALISYYNYVDNTDEELLLFLKNSFRTSFDLIYQGYVDHNFMSFFTWALQFLREMYLIENELEWRLYTEIIIDEALKHRNEGICKNGPCIISKASGEYAYFEGIAAVNFMYKNNKNLWWIEEKSVTNYLDLASKEISTWQIKSLNDFNEKNNLELNTYPKNLVGSFCNSYHCQYTRIDFMQHALSAYLFLYKDNKIKLE